MCNFGGWWGFSCWLEQVFFLLPPCPYWLWDPFSLLSRGWSGQGRKLTIHLYLVLRLISCINLCQHPICLCRATFTSSSMSVIFFLIDCHFWYSLKWPTLKSKAGQMQCRFFCTFLLSVSCKKDVFMNGSSIRLPPWQMAEWLLEAFWPCHENCEVQWPSSSLLKILLSQ